MGLDLGRGSLIRCRGWEMGLMLGIGEPSKGSDAGWFGISVWIAVQEWHRSLTRNLGFQPAVSGVEAGDRVRKSCSILLVLSIVDI